MDLLPRMTGDAAENMARDLLLLEAHPRPEVPRLRLYGWSEPAHTFGISQRWAEWRPLVPASSVLVRRPTGGGLVSHLEDWTFAAAIPAGHPVFGLEAIRSYAVVLGALRDALTRLGAEVDQVPLPSGPRAFLRPAACGERPEPFDLLAPAGNRKAAGAAQKRTRDGLLMQGYVERSALPGLDWESLDGTFAVELGRALGSSPRQVATDEVDPGRLREGRRRFGSPEWNERA